MTESSQSSHHVIESRVYSANAAVTSQPHVPSVSASAVLAESTTLPPDTPQCRGHDFSTKPNTLEAIVESMMTTGFQATSLSRAVEQVRRMRQWRLRDVPFVEGVDDPALRPAQVRERIRARIFLAYTSNQISCGQREVIRFLVQHRMVDVVITTAGGVEEDLIKCLQPTFLGDFALSGRELRRKGINRIGNLLVPNKNYCEFEDWVSPILHRMHDELDEATRQWARKVSLGELPDDSGEDGRFLWTPSKVIERLGKEIDHPDSVLFWAAKNGIPVFCPALTDGSLGDMLYFHSYKRRGFVLDICEDIRRLNDLAVRSHCTGQIICGGGLIKHHCCNANLMRNGADFSVFINTASEYDGSDSGASPDEAISWGKIRITADPVKVTGDATILFPLIVSQTFAKDVEAWKESTSNAVCWIDDLQLTA